MTGRIFTVNRAPTGRVTETCRDCGWNFSYRLNPHPTQRAQKANHTCPHPATTPGATDA